MLLMHQVGIVVRNDKGDRVFDDLPDLMWFRNDPDWIYVANGDAIARAPSN